VKAAILLSFQDLVPPVVDLRERSRAVWRELDGADPRTYAQTGYLSCLDGHASQVKRWKGPSPFAA